MPRSSHISICALVGLLSFFSLWSTAHAQSPARDKPSGGTISGRIIIEQKGANGVSVVLTPCDYQRGAIATPTSITAKTNSDGEYTFDSVPPGAYCINAYAPVATGTTRQGTREKLLTIADGETVDGIDLTFVKGGVITGRILDGDGRPMIETPVSIIRAGNAGSSYTPSVVTDDRGIYRAYGLQPGRYIVSAGNGRPAGGAVMPLSYGYRTTYYPGVVESSKAKPVEVAADQETTDIDINLGQSIKSFSVSGTVVNVQNGSPVPNAQIGITIFDPNRRISGGSFPQNDKSNRVGEFTFDNIAPGHYALQLRKTQGFDFYEDMVPFDVTDRDVSGLIINVYPSVSISGVVTIDGPYDPIANFQLTQLIVQGSDRSSASGASGAAISKVEPDGSFRVTGLHPGLCGIGLVTPPPDSPFTQFRVLKDGVELRQAMEISPGEAVSTIQIIVGYGRGILRGTVKIEGENIPPDLHLTVSAMRSDEPKKMYTAVLDARNQFVMSNLLPGHYDLSAGTSLVGPSGRPIRVQTQRQSVDIVNGREESVVMIATTEQMPPGRKP